MEQKRFLFYCFKYVIHVASSRNNTNKQFPNHCEAKINVPGKHKRGTKVVLVIASNLRAGELDPAGDSYFCISAQNNAIMATKPCGESHWLYPLRCGGNIWLRWPKGKPLRVQNRWPNHARLPKSKLGQHPEMLWMCGGPLVLRRCETLCNLSALPVRIWACKRESDSPRDTEELMQPCISPTATPPQDAVSIREYQSAIFAASQSIS